MPIGRAAERDAEPSSEPGSEPAEKLRRPWEEPPRRSTSLEMIAREADAHTCRAFELAGRGACFSARSEFIMTLRLVAQGLDTQGRTTVHSEALAQGLTVLREAEDFLPSGSRLEADLDMPGIIAGHRTPVLKGFPLDGITPLVAMQRYFTFAQEQLAVAAAEEVAGSMALEGLGKLHAALADDRAADVKGAEPKAVVFYQAALLVYPHNYMASNDLGVLMARAGHYAEARLALVHSLSIRPHAVGWRNLAVVYRELGQMDLAMQAAQRWQSYRKVELAGGRQTGPRPSPMVCWVTPENFARSYAQTPDPVRTRPVARPAAVAASRGTRGQAGSQRGAAFARGPFPQLKRGRRETLPNRSAPQEAVRNDDSPRLVRPVQAVRGRDASAVWPTREGPRPGPPPRTERHRRPPRRAWWAAWLVLLATCGLLAFYPGSKHTPCAVRQEQAHGVCRPLGRHDD